MSSVYRTSLSVLFWILAIVMLVPFAWMISASFKPSTEVFRFPVQWIPDELYLRNYKLLFAGRHINFLTVYWNTIYVTFMSMLGTLVVGSMTAYAYAKIKFKGREVFFLLLLASIAIPFQVVMIPQFFMFRAVGLLDTLTSQWIGNFINPFLAIFFLRQYFKGIPDELIDAAKIDGAGHLRICWRIVVPMSRPAIVTVMMLYFVFSWNNYEQALIYLRTPENYVVSLAVKVFASEVFSDYGAIMASAVLAIIPILIVLSFGQKYIIAGMTTGALKE